LTLGIRETDQVGDNVTGTVTRSTELRLTAPVGAVSLEADVDLGSVTGARARSFRNVRAGVRWQSGGQWARLGIDRYDNGLSAPSTRLDLAGALEVLTATVHGGLNLSVDRAADRWVSLWSAVEVPLHRDYDLLTGVDYASGRAESSRLSVGVRRRIGLPLPTRRRPVLEGVVFDDRNGNRVLDTGEPVLPGIRVQLGALRATTDADGRFEFFDRGGDALRVVTSSLPSGALVPADVYLPGTGNVQVPVMRTASLELELFLDRDGDGVRDDVESAAGGATVSVEGPYGSSRLGVTDDEGRIRFTGLGIGEHTIRVERAGGEPYEARITLEPGAHVTRSLAVPARSRDVRLRTSRSRPPTTTTPSDSTDGPDTPDAVAVLFEFGSADVASDGVRRLANVVERLHADSLLTITVSGHADATGPAAYNMGLSERRAVAVADYLEGQGIATERIRIRSFGETRPVADNRTREGRELNRRVDVRIESPANAAGP
ncbi:MAG: OmpA family protein, partial [Gemmatimonadota bacterium]